MGITTETAADEDAVGLARGGRMSRQRKRDAVLRLLRGEDLKLVSHSLGVTAATLSSWREVRTCSVMSCTSEVPRQGSRIKPLIAEPARQPRALVWKWALTLAPMKL